MLFKSLFATLWLWDTTVKRDWEQSIADGGKAGLAAGGKQMHHRLKSSAAILSSANLSFLPLLLSSHFVFHFFFCQFWVFPCYVLFWVHIFPGVAAIAFAWIWSSSISWRTPAKIAFSRKWLHSNFKTFKIVFGKTLLLETIIEVLEIYIMLISTWIWKYYHKVYIHF